MTNFSMVRSFEDFLINPTYVPLLERELPRRSSQSFHPASSSRRYSCSHILNFTMDQTRLAPTDPPFNMTKPSEESLATIKPFDNQPALARGYTSDEEAASPIDTSDAASLQSLSDSASNISIIERPIPAVAKAIQLSNCAQAVQLVSAGKVKVVSMPKIAESPKSPALPRPSTASIGTISLGEAGATRHKRELSESSTKSTSPRESTSMRSARPISWKGPPLLELDVNARRRRPSLPAIMTSSNRPSSPSPMTPARTARQPDFLKHDPFPSSNGSPKTPLSSPISQSSRRMMPMFINKLIKRRDSIPVLEDVPELTPQSALSNSSTNKPKMIARGADEIEPTIRLPPCPKNYAAEDLTSWPLRKDSVTFARPHKRARSVMI